MALKKLEKLLQSDNPRKGFIYALRKPKYISVWQTGVSKKLRLTDLVASLSPKLLRKELFLLLEPFYEQLVEMAENPAFSYRRFAYNVLRWDNSSRSFQIMLKGLHDTDYRLRNQIIRDIIIFDSESMYNALLKIALEDPILSVRQSSCARLRKDFKDLFHFDRRGLEDRELRHLTEQLDINIQADKELAFSMLEPGVSIRKDILFRVYSFLDKSGELSRLLHSCEISNTEKQEEIYQRLKIACELSIYKFLNNFEKTNAIGVLIVIFRLLNLGININLLNKLGARVLNGLPQKMNNEQLLNAMLQAFKTVGNQDSIILLCSNIERLIKHSELSSKLLSGLPISGFAYYKTTLFKLLLNPNYKTLEELWNIFDMLPPQQYIYEIEPQLYREDRSSLQRKRLLLLLIRAKRVEVLPMILENLYYFTDEEIADCVKLFSAFPRQRLLNEIRFLLASYDTGTKRVALSLIGSLVLGELKDELEEQLGNDDSVIRIRAFTAMLKLSINDQFSNWRDSILAVLRDRSQKVRKAAGTSLLNSKFAPRWELLQDLAFDSNEDLDIIQSLLHSLNLTNQVEAVETLLGITRIFPNFEDQTLELLSRKHSLQERQVILAEYLQEEQYTMLIFFEKIFLSMEPSNLDFIVDYLKEKDLRNPGNGDTDLSTAGKSKISRDKCIRILECSGYVAKLLENIRSERRDLRKKTLDLLLSIETPASYQGILLSIRDNDLSIREKASNAIREILSPKNASGAIYRYLESSQNGVVKRNFRWAKKNLGGDNSLKLSDSADPEEATGAKTEKAKKSVDASS